MTHAQLISQRDDLCRQLAETYSQKEALEKRIPVLQGMVQALDQLAAQFKQEE